MNTPLPARLWRLSLLMLLGFGPLTLLYALIGLLGALELLTGSPGGRRLDSLLLLALPFALLGFCLQICDWLLLRAQSWWLRTLVLYGGWLALVCPPIVLLVSALGGVSMATVDGVATATREAALLPALEVLAAAHLLIVPWAAGAALLLPRLTGTPQSQPSSRTGRAGQSTGYRPPSAWGANRAGGGFDARTSVTQAPRPAVLVACTRPPCASATSRQKNSPRPLPRWRSGSAW